MPRALADSHLATATARPAPARRVAIDEKPTERRHKVTAGGGPRPSTRRGYDPEFATRFPRKTLIGRGGIGDVYAAQDTTVGRRVALKVLRPDRMLGHDVARMRREIRIMERLAELDHPNLPALIAASAGTRTRGTAGSAPWMALELIRGQTLADRLIDGPVPFAHAVAWLRDLASVLCAAHAVGIVHRDLKPGNVLLGERVILIDWGISHDHDSPDGGRITEVGLVAGTPRYMSPEQAQDLDTGPSSDVYSLGVMAYELLSGDAPFTGGSSVSIAVRHVTEAPAPLAPGTQPGRAALTAMVMSMLAKAPADRPTMAEVLAGLSLAGK